MTRRLRQSNDLEHQMAYICINYCTSAFSSDDPNFAPANRPQATLPFPQFSFSSRIMRASVPVVQFVRSFISPCILAVMQSLFLVQQSLKMLLEPYFPFR